MTERIHWANNAAARRRAGSGFAVLLVAVAAATVGAEDVQPIAVGRTWQLFVDDHLVARLEGAALRLNRPRRQEVVFKFDAPWEGPQSAYVSVMTTPDGFRMYYRGGGDLSRESVCVALSDDGVNWTRPQLGLFEFNGSRANNIVWQGEKKGYDEAHNFAPFLDARPGVPAAERYKAITLDRFELGGQTRKALAAFQSADGRRWERLQEGPIITRGRFDSLNVAFWDTARERYVCYFRCTQAGKRSVCYATSADFRNWSEPAPVDFGDAPAEHLYTNGIFAYERAPGWLIGLAQRFVPERTTIGFPPRTIDGVSDGVLLSSRDGIRFERTFLEAYIRPGRDRANWGGAHGNNCPAQGVLRTGPGELSVYWAEHYADPGGGMGTPQLRRGTLGLERFAALHAGYAGGTVVTRPLRVAGERLLVNFATSAVGSVRVEVLRGDEQPVAGFSGLAAVELYGDELARPVTWVDGGSLEPLVGKVVRLRIGLQDADLYALRFAGAAPGGSAGAGEQGAGAPESR